MKTHLLVATIMVGAGFGNAAEMLPPDSEGRLELQVEIGSASAALVVDYAPPATGTVRAEFISEVIARTVTAGSSAQREPVRMFEKFTLDSEFAASERFNARIYRDETVLHVPVRIQSAILDQVETGPYKYGAEFIVELDVRTRDGWETRTLRMEASRMDSLFALFRENMPGLEACWSLDPPEVEDLHGYLRNHTVYSVVDWSYGNGNVFYEFVFYPQWLYYVGSVATTQGYPVYHLAFEDEQGEPLRIGWLKRTLSGGVPDDKPSMSRAEAVEKLRQLQWDFGGTRYSDWPPVATTTFYPQSARMEKLAYQISLAMPGGGPIVWQEQFTPEGADAPTDIRWMSWTPQPGESESPVYYLDPLEEGNPHRHPEQAGVYEVVLLDGSGGLIADVNRDRRLNLPHESVDDVASVNRPFRYWINDDDDEGATKGDDRPDQKGRDADASDNKVDSIRDLVDFFPVFVDVAEFLDAVPEPDQVKFRLKHADAAVNVVFTELPRDRAFEYRETLWDTGFGPNLDQPVGAATATQVTASGIELSPAFVDRLRAKEGGVILVEGRAATQEPLVLSVEVGGQAIAEFPLALRISRVEEMFRHVDLTGVATEYDGSPAADPPDAAATRTDEPPNMPDAENGDRYFVFIHGYNVDGQEARGWHAEIFKRLHAAGSRARFVGVTWHGATGLDYHKAVFQAFQSGDALPAGLQFMGNTPLVIAAHSLGNVVASHAIESQVLAPEQYLMINAATPIESYAPENADRMQEFEMTERRWKNYDRKLTASEWWRLFPADDNRSKLTWQGRFRAARVTAINFYSSQEDVVANMHGVSSASVLATVLRQGFDLSRGAWKAQELVKGVPVTVSLVDLFMERDQGGWGFNPKWYPPWDDPVIPRYGKLRPSYQMSPEEAAALNQEALRSDPFHRKFFEDDLRGDDPSRASALAAEPKVIYDLLARGIPASSNAMAANYVRALGPDRNFNMAIEGVANNILPTPGHDFRHSDFKVAAFVYVFPVFEMFVKKGQLK